MNTKYVFQNGDIIDRPLNIAVFGGSGYIMGQAVKQGAEKGHNMVCIDMKAPEYTWPRQMFVKANLSTEDSTKYAFEAAEKQLADNGIEGKIDAVANGIAILSYTKTVGELYGPNVLTARNIARHCAENGQFLVHLSGVAVQGISNPLPLREEYPLAPIEPYGITKALSELEVFNANGKNSIILRADVVIGPDNLGTMILQMFETAKGYAVPRPSTINSYINTIDIGKAIIFAIEHRQYFSRPGLMANSLSDIVCNICDKEPITDGQGFDFLTKIIPAPRLLGLIPFRIKTDAPSSKYLLRTLGLLTETAAKITKTKPALPYNLAKLAHVGHAQSREKFENVFEGRGFKMTFNSTYESLEYVVKWLYENHWKEPMPGTFPKTA